MVDVLTLKVVLDSLKLLPSRMLTWAIIEFVHIIIVANLVMVLFYRKSRYLPFKEKCS